ncbi:hypothetical protein GUJ93_ZPchr0011g28009 [Zizania palustris]|uniref:Uncharacterized protein n=1 Tax=Zizania palustris TaxID=103762 RepID=A0A8J5WIJ3_ZIZPA|nr:hypothetical protein GUJ93_ZPchr0011g28009 [Zizania palustris]
MSPPPRCLLHSPQRLRSGRLAPLPPEPTAPATVGEVEPPHFMPDLPDANALLQRHQNQGLVALLERTGRMQIHRTRSLVNEDVTRCY